MTKLRQNEFYCVSCRKKVRIPSDEITLEYDIARKPRLTAYCHRCETALYKYVRHAQADRLARKFNEMI